MSTEQFRQGGVLIQKLSKQVNAKTTTTTTTTPTTTTTKTNNTTKTNKTCAWSHKIYKTRFGIRNLLPFELLLFVHSFFSRPEGQKGTLLKRFSKLLGAIGVKWSPLHAKKTLEIIQHF